MAFTPDKTKERHTIAYNQVTELEYGQKAGRRVAVALSVSPVALFSKKRRHYLTINFKDDAAKDQAVVFELGKDIVRTTLAVIEARTGKKIQYQDEEARKSGKGGDLRSHASAFVTEWITGHDRLEGRGSKFFENASSETNYTRDFARSFQIEIARL